jgi:IPT/TIG domain
MKLTTEKLREVWRSILDSAYRKPYEKAGLGGGLEIWEQAIDQCTRVADAVYTTMGALYLMPSAGQYAPPAGGAAHARVTLTIKRGALAALPLILAAGTQIEESTIDATPDGGEVVLTGRRYRLTESAYFPPGDTSVTVVVEAEAERPGYGYNNPLPDTITAIVQNGVQLESDTATVTIGGGTTTPVFAQIQTPNRADMFVADHVGQYVVAVGGANTGRAARAVGYIPPDPSRGFTLGGSAIRLSQDLSVRLDANPFAVGDLLSATGWSGRVVGVNGVKLMAETLSDDPIAVGLGAVLTGASGSGTVEFVDENRTWQVETGTCQWRLLDWSNDFAVTVSHAASPAGGRSEMLGIIGSGRSVNRASGESDDSYRERIHRSADLVSPNALRRAVSRVLDPQPYCIDEAGYGDLRGIFADVTDYTDQGGLYVTLDTTDSAAVLGAAFQEPISIIDSGGVEYAAGWWGRSIIDPGPSRIVVFMITRSQAITPALPPTLFLKSPTFGTFDLPIYSIAKGEVHRGRTLMSGLDFRGYFKVCRAPDLAMEVVAADTQGWFDGVRLDAIPTGDRASNVALWSVVNDIRAGGVGADLCNQPCTDLVPLPTLIRLVLSEGTVGDLVELIGYGFTGTSAVTLGGVSAAFTVVDDRHMTLTVPAASTGPLDVTFTTPAGTRTYFGAFTYLSGGTAMVLATEDLGAWFVAGDVLFDDRGPGTVDWAGRASMGNSGLSTMQELGGFDPPVAGAPFGSADTLDFPTALPYPALASADTVVDILGFDGVTRKEFTLAAVIAPNFTNAASFVSGSILDASGNANVISFDDFLGIYAGMDGGDLRIGFGTYNGAYTGTSSAVWPGGVGTYGSVLICGYDLAGTFMVDTWINGVLEVSEACPYSLSASGSFQVGAIGGGAHPSFELIESLYAFPRALDTADRTRFFRRLKLDHPSLPMPPGI